MHERLRKSGIAVRNGRASNNERRSCITMNAWCAARAQWRVLDVIEESDERGAEIAVFCPDGAVDRVPAAFRQQGRSHTRERNFRWQPWMIDSTIGPGFCIAWRAGI